MDSFWKDKRVCVTGGGGFLGFQIVRALRERGANVRVFTLPPGPTHPLWTEPKVKKVFGDLRNAQLLQEAFADCEVVFHTAGTVAVWGPGVAGLHQVHVAGTQNVLNAAPPGARVIHTSSIVTIGGTRTGEVLSEDSTFDLQSLRVNYVHAKRAAEDTVLEAARGGRDVVVVNPGYLVGPEDHEGSVMGRFCLRFWKGRLLFAPSGGFNFVDVRDAAVGHLLAAVKGVAGKRYILGGENRSLREFMNKLSATAAMQPRALPRLPGWVMYALAGASESRAWLTGREPYPALQHVRLNRYCWYVSSKRAEEELGYKSRPLDQTLADTYEWFRTHRPFSLRRLNRWWMRPAA